MKWKRSNKGSTVFYHPKNITASKYRIQPVSEVNVKELEAGLTDESIYISHNEISGLAITYTEQEVPGEDLPVGSYHYILGGGGYPDRLEVKEDTRKEAYVELHNVEAVLKDMNRFLESKAVYEEMNIAHRRGYLIYGPPGNGKTVLIRSLLNTHFKDAVVVWCSSLPDPYFMEELNAINKLKILVLEELTNKDGGSNYSMKKLLNTLDGEESLTNAITIATTNYPELLAKNLADRPSRFDMVIEVKNPSTEDTKRLLELFVGHPVSNEEMPEVKDMSVAHIKEIAIIHKLYSVDLKEAYERLLKQSNSFKQNFEEKKKFGI